MIEGNTVTAMDRNTFQRGQPSKWPPRSPQMTFKMGPDLKMIVLVNIIIAQNVIFYHQMHNSLKNLSYLADRPHNQKSELPCDRPHNPRVLSPTPEPVCHDRSPFNISISTLFMLICYLQPSHLSWRCSSSDPFACTFIAYFL